jgi:C-terminal processing protease CtpA/Prc
MGPVMNILLAVIVMAVVLAQGAETPAYLDEPPVLGTVTPGSAAEKAGLRRGDRVLTVGRERGRHVGALREGDLSAGRPRLASDVRPRRTDRIRDGSARPAGQVRDGDIGVCRTQRRSSRALIKGDVAEKAGLKAGDVSSR